MKAADYKKRIWTYEKRRKEAYKTSRRLSTKIWQMRKCLYSMEAREKQRKGKVERLVASINDFFSVDIKSSRYDKSHKIARNVYFKIGIESQLKQTDLCRAINRRGGAKTASSSRMNFTKTFKENPENKEIFYNFKSYYKSLG